MITLNMQQKNSEITITDTMFDIENNTLTLQATILDGGLTYDLTGKTITASFSQVGKESEILSVVDGIIQLPVYSSYVKGGQNIIHFIFRWGTDKVEVSPAILWNVKGTVKINGIAQENVDIVTSLIAQLNTAIANVGEITAGAQGDSAYEIAVTNGYVGTEIEWVASLKGEKGDTGAQGLQGIQGLQGDKGDKGDKGDQGIQGIQGEQGVKGDTGATGAKGDKGDTGATGAQGIQGEQGIQGTAGIGIVNQRTSLSLSLWAGTQAQHTALGTYDGNTVYLIEVV